ncbi:putative uncharacterized protein [Candidatus Colimorpha enterica]|uniref:Uncharacterized protein n=1 Tax=Candidatus Colimorpha enterica TaxID=3083063 RepID=R6TPC6_9BACT|nr:putative uncharacterized protein [Candidatus Colimorpha enterica]
MKKALEVLQKILHPPKWALFFAPPVVFAALIYIFLTGQNNSTPAYVIYGMSAYCLTVLVLPLPRLIRNAKVSVMRRINGMAFGGRYINDLAFRGSVSIYQGMTVNFLYVLFRIVVGIRYTSMWFISMAVYYLVLAVLRLSLILSYRQKVNIDELRCYRRTAWLIFLLNIPMGGMITLMVLTNSGYSYPGYVIYLSAMYTFYTMVTSVINLVRFRRLGSPILSAAKVLNFIAALMSILGLQTAMIAQFSVESDSFRKTMNAITGGVIWLCVILTAVYMLRRSRKMQSEVKSVE